MNQASASPPAPASLPPAALLETTYGARSFHGLYAKLIEFLEIGVCVGATNATRSEPSGGVWRLDHARLQSIIDGMLARGRFDSVAQALLAFDDTGIEHRFFRLAPEVAAWIDATEPTGRLDFLLL